MAHVIFSGLEVRAAKQLANLLKTDGHEIRRDSTWQDNAGTTVEKLLRSDIVFVGGDRSQFLSLLRRLRKLNQTLPVVVVSRLPETSEWLDVLDAGATDYCTPPFDLHQIRSLVSPRGMA